MHAIHPAFRQALRHIAPPSPTTTVDLGGVPFVIEYDYSPAEKPNYDVNSPLVGPGCAASVDLIEVKVGGYDVGDCLNDSTRRCLEARLLEILGGAE